MILRLHLVARLRDFPVSRQVNGDPDDTSLPDWWGISADKKANCEYFSLWHYAEVLIGLSNFGFCHLNGLSSAEVRRDASGSSKSLQSHCRSQSERSFICSIANTCRNRLAIHCRPDAVQSKYFRPNLM
jgi:hypothetical protein